MPPMKTITVRDDDECRRVYEVEAIESRNLIALFCFRCGVKVNHPNPKQRFCSEPCRVADWQERNRRAS